MSRAEYTELVGVGVALAGLWLLAAGLFGALSPFSIGTAGVLLLLFGGSITASANKHRTAVARQVDDE